jgi:hypothetical protein
MRISRESISGMQYPEQWNNNPAFRHFFLFLAIFLIQIPFGTLRQLTVLGRTGIPFKKRMLLTGLYAVAQASYHPGRGTFSGSLGKKVKKDRAGTPGLLPARSALLRSRE